MTDTILHVGGALPYDVVVGRGLGGRLPEMLGPGVERVAVVCPERLEAFLDDLLESVTDVEVMVLEVPDGEESKHASVAEACWEALGEAGFTRSDAVVTVGGGATTDANAGRGYDFFPIASMPLTGPRPPVSAGATDLDVPPTRSDVRDADTAAGTGTCS